LAGAGIIGQVIFAGGVIFITLVFILLAAVIYFPLHHPSD